MGVVTRQSWDGSDITIVSGTVSIDSGGVTIAAPSTAYSTSYSYKFTPNATIAGTSWGVFARNADTNNRYLGLQNIVTTNSKNAWIEFIATGKTSGAVDVNGSISIYCDGAVNNTSSVTLTGDSITLTGSTTITSGLTIQGSGGVTINYAMVVGASGSGDPLLIQVGGTNKCRFDNNGDLRPETDNTQHVGVPSKRFAYMTALSFNTTDVALDNGWSLTESYRLGITEPGVGLVDDAGQLVAFFGRDKTYLKTLALVDDLPHALTTLDQRIHMDPTPEVRVKGYQSDGAPIYKTGADVEPFPAAKDINTTRRRKAGV
ncbi:MAG: hypothetical protein ABI603_01745 [Acidobacteriota bacterium]